MISVWHPNDIFQPHLKVVSHSSQAERAAALGYTAAIRGLGWKESPWAGRRRSCCLCSLPVGTRSIWENSKYFSFLVFSSCLRQKNGILGTSGKSRFIFSITFSWFYKLIFSKIPNFHNPRKHFLLSDSRSTWLDSYNRTWLHGAGYPSLPMYIHTYTHMGDPWMELTGELNWANQILLLGNVNSKWKNPEPGGQRSESF